MLIGVDGGNTKTVALVATPDGTVVGRGRSGCSDIHNAPSVEVALDAMAAACQDALFEAGIAASDVSAACFNLAGADWPEDFDLLRRAIPELVGLPQAPLVVNDAIAPIRAGTADGAGVSVVCGTFGTTAARNRDGHTYHVGFWPDRTGARGLGQRRPGGGLAIGAPPRSGDRADSSGHSRCTARRRRWSCCTASPGAVAGRSRTRSGWRRLYWTRRRRATRWQPRSSPTMGAYWAARREPARMRSGCWTARGSRSCLTGGVFHNPSAVLSDAILSNLPEADPVPLHHAPVIGALLLAFDEAGLDPDVSRIVEGAHA